MDNEHSAKPVRKNTTSCEVRNRWNSNHYDRINVTIPKGYGDLFKKYCDEHGTAMNSVLSAIVAFEMEHASAKV